MYATIVSSKVRKVFAALSQQDTGPMLATLAGRFEYRFAGDHPLGGRRTTVAQMQEWWARVFEMLPVLRFEVRSIAVQGLPWNTTVATHIVLHGELADGSPYENEFMQFMTLVWGKATRVDTLEDLQRLQVALVDLEAKGYALATAAPIGSAAGLP